MKDLIMTLESQAATQQMRNSMPEVFDYSFKGFGVHQSTIRVHIYNHNGWNLVVFQDLGEGTSVTNASEQLATEIGKLKDLDPQKTVWLECYPYYGGDYNIDAIKYDYHDGTYSNPDWKPMKNEVIIDFLRKNIKP